MQVSLVQDEAVARACFDDFNFWKKQTNRWREMREAGRPMRDPHFNDERRLIMLEFVSWCRAKQVDPRFFIYALYAARNWLFTVKLEHIRSEGILKRFKGGSFRETEPYRRRITNAPVAVATKPQTQQYDPNVDLSTEVEARKDLFIAAGQPQVCLDQMDYPPAPTYGFHPKSQACRGCPIALQCRQKLSALFHPVDVLAVREGRMTAQQADVIHANHHR